MQPLPQRVLSHERLELADQLGVAAELELGRDALLERAEAQLLEPGDLRLGERLVRELRECRPAPERQCLREQPGALVRRGSARPLDSLLEPGDVELAGLDVDDVARRPRLQPLGAERLAELGDAVLERGRRRRRRRFAPELVDEPVRGDHAVGVDQKQSEQGALPRARDRDGLAVRKHLERPEQAELPRHVQRAYCAPRRSRIRG